VLYEMLTSRKPFAADEEMAVAHAILHETPKVPSAHRPDLPDAVEDLVLWLLHKDPAKRIADAAKLVSELDKTGAMLTVLHPKRRRMRAVRRAFSGSGMRIVVRALAALFLVSAAGYAAIARNDLSDAAPSRMSIAVLPFRNLSADGPNAFFAGGLHDEILNQLYKVPSLRVIGRSSVMSYGEANARPIRQIARELGAGSVVEGSVQIVGNRVRVTVQLSDPAIEAPLWVERYDRALDDAFAIESDIAQQIVATLGAALTTTQRTGLSSVPTEKTEAYLQYLRGRDSERRPGILRSNLDEAQRLYERALALDPNFAQAQASLSTVHTRMYWLRYDMTSQRLTRARQAAENALRLSPDLADARIAMAQVHNQGPDTDVRAGLEELLAAARSHPNNAQVWRWIAQSHRRLGEWDRFSEPFANAVRLDPRNVDLLWDQGGGTHNRMGRYAESIYWYDRALRIAPNLSTAMIGKAWTYFAYQGGQLDTLRAVLDRISERTEMLAAESLTGHRARLLYFERKPDSLLRVLAASRVPVFQSVTGYTPVQLWAAWAHELRGDQVAARAAFDSALVVLDSAIRKYPEDWPLRAGRGFALAGLRRRSEALAEVRWLQECWIYRKDAYLRSSVSANIAKILTRAGETTAALERVEQLIAERPAGISVEFLRLDPIWDPIREHPRFRAILSSQR
jgi:TolB-like protein/Tfp pilus assembly protein PilF